MAGEASAQREKQDQSIKARKNELFVGEAEVQTGPRKRLRDYVRETPAAPLSKNVKLILWGSAAPVVFLFIASLATGRSHAKAPTEMVIPVHTKVAVPPIAKVSDHKPAASEPDARKPRDKEPKGDAEAKDEKRPQDKQEVKKKGGGGKNKGKGKGKAKPQKDNTAVAQSGSGDKAGAEESRNNKGGDAKKPASKDSSDSGGMSKTPPKKRAAPLFKPKKPYNPAYPKPDREKKTEAAPDDVTP